MGGTGISTGLNVAFTLGCGTCGGSSVSENVSPMHLINVKKVAYGLKDCTTLITDDVTFRHPELMGGEQQVCGPCRGNVSQEAGCDEQKLAELVRELITTMKKQGV